jgi:condensin complex subunit 2
MSLLKEGDGVNFQKASCTLDGCVKIYTSRVDSVATETGRLLSGLADSGNRKGKTDEQGEEGEDDDEEDGEEGGQKKKKKRAQRSSEATLAPSFSSLQIKKFELEFSVDPLFKKMSADFDEGGAKGLLLNHLSMDPSGKIVFDSSDDAVDTPGESGGAKGDSELEEKDDAETQDVQGDATIMTPDQDSAEGIASIAALGAKFFPNLEVLDGQDICPSLKTFDLGDPAGSTNIPFLKAPEDWRQDKNEDDGAGFADKSGIFLDGDNPPGFDDDDDDALGGFDLNAETGFGNGGEMWAKDAVIDTQSGENDGFEGGLEGEEGEGVGPFNGSNEYVVSLHQEQSGGHADILNYFDEQLRKNWAGPEHWRIRRIKDTTKTSAPTTTKRKEKEPFEIDFSSTLDPILAESIYTQASSSSAISLPKAQWKSKTRNLLPDDKHFNSRQLLRLFLKPKARIGSKRKLGFGARRPAFGLDENLPAGEEMDENFWARKEEPVIEEGQGIEGNYDANFFQDDGLALAGAGDDDDEDFADAREHFSPGLEAPGGGGSGGVVGIEGILNAGGEEGAFGTQLVTQSRRLRPEYVQYARVAKKVDVRRLKEDMWKGMGTMMLEDQVSLVIH